MSNSSMQPYYDEHFENVRQWHELIMSPYFSKLVDKINLEVTTIDTDINKLVSDPTLDNSIKATSLAKAKEKLISLLRHFKAMENEKLRLDIQKSKNITYENGIKPI